MIGHDHLAAVGDHQLRSRHAALFDAPEFIHQDRYIERNTVSDHIHDLLMKNTGRKRVQGKFAVIIDDRMSRIRSALEADHNICSIRKSICDLTLAFISPVCTNYCFYHNSFSSIVEPEERVKNLVDTRLFTPDVYVETPQTSADPIGETASADFSSGVSAQERFDMFLSIRR